MLVWNKQWEMQSVRAFSGVWWAYSCLWIYFQYTEMLDFSYSSITLWTSQQLLWILSLDHVGFSGLVGWGRQGRHGITSSWGDSSCKGPLEVIQHQDTPRPGGWPCRVKPGLCPSMEIPWYLCDLSFIGIFFFPLYLIRISHMLDGVLSSLLIGSQASQEPQLNAMEKSLPWPACMVCKVSSLLRGSTADSHSAWCSSHSAQLLSSPLTPRFGMEEYWGDKWRVNVVGGKEDLFLFYF